MTVRHSPSGLIVATAFQLGCVADQPARAVPDAAFTLDALAATVPRVELSEALRLDADREDFSTLTRLYSGPDGTVLLPLFQDLQVRSYDEEGRLSISVGRRGGGPGEFESLSTMGAVGDTIWAHDSRQNRVTFVDPSGTVLRTVAIPDGVLRDTAGNALGPLFGFTPMVIYENGFMLGEGRTFDELNRRITQRAVVLVTNGGEAKLLFYPPSYEDPRWMMEISGFGRSVPFTMSPQLSWSPSSRRLATLHAEALSDDGGTLHLAVYDVSDPVGLAANERLLRPVVERSFDYVGDPIPRSAVDSVLATFIPESGRPREGPADLPERFQEAARAQMPSVYPRVNRMRMGRDDTIWLELRPGEEGRAYLIMDEEGNPIATAVVPHNTTIWQSDKSQVWALERNEFGLASVVLYRVEGLE